MKLTRTRILLFIAVTAVLVAIPAIALAQAVIPYTVRGTAYVNNQAAPRAFPSQPSSAMTGLSK